MVGICILLMDWMQVRSAGTLKRIIVDSGWYVTGYSGGFGVGNGECM